MVAEEQPWSEVEEVLRTAAVVESIDAEIKPGTASSVAIETIELEGGVKAFYKRADKMPTGIEGVKREVAAWVTLKSMGCGYLMPATVLRRLPLEGSGLVEVAISELLLDREDHPELHNFEQDEIDRAAAFDAVIHQTDRLNHNWLGVSQGGSMRLKLIDHERAFGFSPAAPVQSAFWDAVGRAVPDDARDSLIQLLDQVQDGELPNLLPHVEFEAMVERLRSMATGDAV